MSTATPTATDDALQRLAELVRDVGGGIAELGELVETEKWGQQSFLPSRPRVGTTVRMGAPDDGHVALFVHCGTTLIDTHRGVFPELTYEGNRAIVFDASEPLPEDEIRMFVRAALLYHRDKRKK